MQLIAVPVGALALAFMYPLLRDTYGVIGDNAQLLSPTSQRWVGFAKRSLRSSPGWLPPTRLSRRALVDDHVARGGSAGGYRAHAARTEGDLAPVRPVPAGMGIAMLIPINAVTVIFLGAAGDRIWAKASPENHQRYSIPIASGLIAGEALVAVVIPLLVTVGVMRLP